ncbi:hypothetical protein POPTR_017G089700v4 [Populus trichocarpa]|uniref:Phosphatidylinositol-3,4,5-trisphosphate 3-phosphatase n=1 Tax=Populus trichocarpa TaxID=3694 RepID=B9IK35_POPTR|nr:phosphatidylinositol 3,4,5-trisphosphate 3-phosphatase and protein-tyrosine-phosphatase PTEN1 [Populus trichocarpa]PNS95990.1 hypothetical protein POPTR_017G089700v4 [Populus trichocarpa]|eukprot:XP_002324090.2 phosphatidylinositol 3,4,5-trisphosphate 3-phosphatase and protein-tyrosine-phosphatase PTEN1 [Populus trichocarpa]
MGLKFAKQGPGKALNTDLSHAQLSLINCITKSIYIRNWVSKHRRRMLVAGYDLDMSYITGRILAMSFPAERVRAMYRNPLWQVKSVLDMRHGEHYKIYNLCIEEAYDPSHFHGRVETYPFDDNHVPPLEMMKLFCESVGSWLSSDPRNIAVVHCMAGKGRTGLMVCAYLVYSGMTPEDALQLYANKRTTNNQGVSIPSQRRYVGYWAEALSFPKRVYDSHRGDGHTPPEVILPQSRIRELRRIRLYDMVNTESVFFVVSELQEIPGQLYRPSVEVAKSCLRPIIKGYQRNSSPQYYISFTEGNEEEEEDLKPAESRLIVQMDTESPIIYQKTTLDYYFDKPIRVKGDVRVIFYQKMIGGRLFYVCFNTAFIRNGLLQFSTRDLDKVGTKGRSICGPAFCLELLFAPANSNHSGTLTEDDNGGGGGGDDISNDCP